MKVLVTGDRGRVGAQVAADLSAAGHTVVGFDRVDGCDVMDRGALVHATQGCDAVVHCAALLHTEDELGAEVLRVNVEGTCNVLDACEAAGVTRLVYMSSAAAIGVFKGERAPDYLPLDNEHLCAPTSPYAASKRIAEQICEYRARAGALSVVALRPPGVWTPETVEFILASRAASPEFEWSPFWEYGAFIDLRDLGTACVAALTCPVDAFVALLVSAPDLSTSGRTGREWAQFVHPEVPWRGDDPDRDPFETLLDLRPALEHLSWRPRHSWASLVAAAARPPGR